MTTHWNRFKTYFPVKFVPPDEELKKEKLLVKVNSNCHVVNTNDVEFHEDLMVEVESPRSGRKIIFHTKRKILSRFLLWIG